MDEAQHHVSLICELAGLNGDTGVPDEITIHHGEKPTPGAMPATGTPARMACAGASRCRLGKRKLLDETRPIDELTDLIER